MEPCVISCKTTFQTFEQIHMRKKYKKLNGNLYINKKQHFKNTKHNTKADGDERVK